MRVLGDARSTAADTQTTGDDLTDARSVLIESVGVAGVAALSYGATNLDNLMVVAAYAAKSGYRPRFVKLAFVIVCITVLLISLALAQAADALPPDRLRWLGVVPMALGSWHLAVAIGRWQRGAGRDDDAPSDAIGAAGYVGFALALLGNSSDSVAVMTPLLADLKPALALACFSAAVATAVLMGGLATYISGYPAWRARIEPLSEWAVPFILIAIGALILAGAPSDALIE